MKREEKPVAQEKKKEEEEEFARRNLCRSKNGEDENEGK